MSESVQAAPSQAPPPEDASGSKASGGASRSRVTFDLGLWLIALAGLGLCAYAFWLQPPPQSFTRQWWQPIELNRHARLPRLPEADLHALWFASPENGYVAGESGLLLRTNDGGRTWTRLDVRDHRGLYALIFAADDANRGWAGGEGGLFLVTTDGGLTWSPVQVAAREPNGKGDYAASNAFAEQTTPNLAAQTATAPRIAVAPNSAVTPEPGSSSGDIIWSFVPDPRGPLAVTTQGLLRPRLAPDLFERDAFQPLVWLDQDPETGDRPRYWELTSPVYAAGAWASGLAVLQSNRIILLDDKGARLLWASEGKPEEMPRVLGFRAADDRTLWLVGENGYASVLTVEAGATTVEEAAPPESGAALFAVWPFSASEALVAGENGKLWLTRDRGRTWEPRSANAATRRAGPLDQVYLRLPGAWFYPMFALLVAGGWIRWRTRPPVKEVRDAVAEELSNDRPLQPGEADHLGFASFVQGLSAYLRNSATQPPLTLSIAGAWGAGKSSFMALLRGDLESHGLRTVWFNAWHHQQEPQILAPLLQLINDEAAPRFLNAPFELWLRFRWRLFWSRVWAQRRLLLSVFLLLCLGLGVGHQLNWVFPLTALKDGLGLLADPGRVLDSVPGIVGGGSFVGVLAALILFVWRAITTFGVKPADLLASQTGRTSRHALTAQASFRRQFAEEFREVTAALKPYPLVVFVDDLDRCNEDKVFQILEAINYLVSSGDCFVVLGMSEERVRDAVALGYRNLPADFAIDGDDPATIRGSEESDTDRGGWAKQRLLAKNYLEKLVQLRVDVPRPGDEALRRFAIGLAGAATEPVSRPHPLRAWWRRRWAVVALTSLVLAAGGTMYLTGRALAPDIQETDTNRSASGGGAAGSGLATSSPEPAQLAAEAAERATFGVPVFRSRRLTSLDAAPGRRNWLGVLAGAVVILTAMGSAWLAQRALHRRREVVIRDTREFREAGDRWSAGLLEAMGSRLTPRTLKRFKNRARYNAMVLRGLREHALSDAEVVALAAYDTTHPGASTTLSAADAETVASWNVPANLKRELQTALKKLADTSTRHAFENVRRTSVFRS